MMENEYEKLLRGSKPLGFIEWFVEYSEKYHHLSGWIDNDLYLDEVKLPFELYLTLIQTFLTEKHNVYVLVKSDCSDGYWIGEPPKIRFGFEIITYNPFNLSESEGYLYNDYTVALHSGILEALMNLNNNNNKDE